VSSLLPFALRCKVLLVENEADTRAFMAMAFQCEGYGVELAGDAEEAVRIIADRHAEFSAVFLDQLMPRKEGFAALRAIRLITLDLPVFITSFAGSPGSAAEAAQAGATHFISKPVTHEELRNHMLRVALPSPAACSPVEGRDGALPHFLGSGRRIREIQGLVRRISESEVPVLIEGETGAGKEVLAREIHANSRRSQKAFLKLNCAALPSELVESELFGYERGAFTGAFQRKPGMFELADSGTILLDEIGDMDFKLQAKLLMVLQDHEFQRLGGKETVHVDVRVMAATHRDLHHAIRHQTFREDLYYRLNVINIHIPPLRERKEDILPLAQHFLNKHRDGDSLPLLPPGLQQAILRYEWPGNVRELENLMQRFLVLRDAGEILRELALRSGKGARVAGASSDGSSAPPVALPAPWARLPDHRPAPAEVEVDHTMLKAAAAAALPAAEAKLPDHRSALADVGHAKAEVKTAANVSPAKPKPPDRRSVLAEVARAKAEGETAAILQVLESTHWNRKRAAQVLNIDYKAMLYKMRKLSIGTGPSESRELALHSGKVARAAAAASVESVASDAEVDVPAAEPRLPDRCSVLADLARTKAEAEAAAILQALESTHWNRKRTARILNINYKALLYRMRKLSIGTSESDSQL
jgi:DNA-binding NtrC family response regulator